MSLINEALKRTRDASYQCATTPPADVSSYRLTAKSSRTAGRKTAVIAAVAVLVLGSVVVLGVFARQMITVQRETAQDVEATPPPAPAQPEKKALDEALIAQVVAKLKAEQAAAKPAVKPPPPAPPAKPPKLVLQGISSDGKTREALINGTDVRVGDVVEDARVVAIEGRTVRLLWNERELVVRMP